MYDKMRQMNVSESEKRYTMAKYLGLAATGLICLGMASQSCSFRKPHMRRRLALAAEPTAEDVGVIFTKAAGRLGDEETINKEELMAVMNFWSEENQTVNLPDYNIVKAATGAAREDLERGASAIIHKFGNGGVLNRSEFYEAWTNTGNLQNYSELVKEEVSSMFTGAAGSFVTDNNTETLNKEELKMLMNVVSPANRYNMDKFNINKAPTVETEDQLDRGATAIMWRFDTNRDGFLDGTEFYEAWTNTGNLQNYSELVKAEVSSMFTGAAGSFNTDNNTETLNKEELKMLMNLVSPANRYTMDKFNINKAPTVETEDQLDRGATAIMWRFDTNRDGFLDGTEFYEAWTNTGDLQNYSKLVEETKAEMEADTGDLQNYSKLVEETKAEMEAELQLILGMSIGGGLLVLFCLGVVIYLCRRKGRVKDEVAVTGSLEDL